MDALINFLTATIHELMARQVFGNTIQAYSISLAIFFGLSLAIRLFYKVFVKKLTKLALKTSNTLDDTILEIARKNLLPLFYFGAFYLAVLSLAINEPLRKMINITGTVLLTILLIRFTIALLHFILKDHFIVKEKDEARASTIKALLPIINVIVWVIGIIFFLGNMGFDISAVVTGLGIGGVAIALAAQSVLGDLFSYFCILFDKPFGLGDFIITGDFPGVVEHIGIKTTRLRSLSGELLVFSNTELTGKPLRNFKHMSERRVVFTFSVPYETGNEKLEQIPTLVKTIIAGIAHTRFDRAHFKNFGDFSLIYEVVYYVDTADYNIYMDIQQSINLQLKAGFEKLEIQFAYPTHTLYFAGGTGAGTDNRPVRRQDEKNISN